MKEREIVLKESEVRTILSVFDGIGEMSYSELNRYVPSMTIKEYQRLWILLDKWYRPNYYKEMEELSGEDLFGDSFRKRFGEGA